MDGENGWWTRVGKSSLISWVVFGLLGEDRAPDLFLELRVVLNSAQQSNLRLGFGFRGALGLDSSGGRYPVAALYFLDFFRHNFSM